MSGACRVVVLDLEIDPLSDKTTRPIGKLDLEGAEVMFAPRIVVRGKGFEGAHLGLDLRLGVGAKGEDAASHEHDSALQRLAELIVERPDLHGLASIVDHDLFSPFTGQEEHEGWQRRRGDRGRGHDPEEHQRPALAPKRDLEVADVVAVPGIVRGEIVEGSGGRDDAILGFASKRQDAR